MTAALIAALAYLAARGVIRLRRANQLANQIYDEELGRPANKPNPRRNQS